MNNVTRILSAADPGDPQTAERLLVQVYNELRRLAAQRLAREKPGLTLQPTALVHEAYLRLARVRARWDNEHHFFAAVARAMRCILVDNARRKNAAKNGGGLRRHDVDNIELTGRDPGPAAVDRLALDEALTKFKAEDPDKAKLAQLHYIEGYSIEEAARELGISPATAKRYCAYARAWLFLCIEGAGQKPAP